MFRLSTTELPASKHLNNRRMVFFSSSMSLSCHLATLLLLSVSARLFCDAAGNHRPSEAGRERSIPRLASRFVPNYSDDEPPRMSIENMTCNFFTQPLDHFAPRGKSPTFEQRYCIYDGYVSKSNQSTNKNNNSNVARSPILFYAGNESPLEQYINHTGLMWELAPQLQAKVVFVEHRYEGQSVPNLTHNCLAYASTIQALADYADILQLHLNPHSEESDPIAPVIAFGGSYGGMLSAWMRMKYPHLVAGAIAASAPIGAFPQQANHNMDGATRVLAHGIQQSYPPDKATRSNNKNQEPNHCLTNLLATWPLISWLVQEETHQEAALAKRNPSVGLQDPGTFLQQVFRLCEPYTSSDPEPLLEFATSLWFDLAEGSFPYPSSYIPFALLHRKVNLPAWPMQKACWTSGLHENWGIVFEGNLTDVSYNITYGDSDLVLSIDWGNVSLVSSSPDKIPISESNSIVGLLTSVRKAISVWHNVTKDVPCFNVSDAAPNRQGYMEKMFRGKSVGTSWVRKLSGRDRREPQPPLSCHEKIKQTGSWEPVCCNDEMNLIITEAQGLGRDFFWPPSLPRGVNCYSDVMRNVTLGPCSDPDGIFGYSRESYDQWSTWLDTYYGSSRMSGHSNIIFSNGLLDPWAAGGVYTNSPFQNPDGEYDGPMVQNITDNDIIALIIRFGGHHTDLMYSNKMDPQCVTKARNIEKLYIEKWIAQWSS